MESAAFDVFAQLGASEEQLDFPVLYASAREGWATAAFPGEGAENLAAAAAFGMTPLLEALVTHVPPPSGAVDAPFSFGVVMTERHPFLGKIVTGRIATGAVAVGDRLRVLGHEEGAAPQDGFKVTRLMKRSGTGSVEISRAVAGDIVSIAGVAAAGVADTVASPEVTVALPPGKIDPPTLSMVFSPNTSPLAGREGSRLTGTQIGERLAAEAETNVSLRCECFGALGLWAVVAWVAGWWWSGGWLAGRLGVVCWLAGCPWLGDGARSVRVVGTCWDMWALGTY